jgi:hypothetical protein
VVTGNPVSVSEIMSPFRNLFLFASKLMRLFVEALVLMATMRMIWCSWDFVIVRSCLTVDRREWKREG